MGTVMLQIIIFRKKEHNYEFLLLKRTLENGGFWQPIGGKMEDKDLTKKEGCLREIFEESKITEKDTIQWIENVHYYNYNKHYLTGKPIPLVEEFVYGLEVKPETNINITQNPDNEHEAFR